MTLVLYLIFGYHEYSYLYGLYKKKWAQVRKHNFKFLAFKTEWKYYFWIGRLLIEAYSQYTKHHSDLLTLKSLTFLPYDFGRIWAYIF